MGSSNTCVRMTYRPFFILLFFLLFAAPVWAQDDDSTAVAVEEATTAEEEDQDGGYLDLYEERPDQQAPNDSLPVASRAFDQRELRALQEDDGLKYLGKSTVGMGIWDWIKMFFLSILRSILEGLTGTNAGNILLWLLGLAVLVVIVLTLLKVDAFKVLYRGKGSALAHQTLEENIHEMNFDDLIQEAVSRQDYRRGVRLTFLYALKILSDNHQIRWEHGKTNHDYLAELKAGETKTGFRDLSFYFDYAWYGNFTITKELYTKVQHTFNNWRTTVK